MSIIGYLDTRGGNTQRISRPNWTLDDGSAVDDSVFIAEGIYPLFDERPLDSARYYYTPTGYEVGELRADVTWVQEERTLPGAKFKVSQAINDLRDEKINGGFNHDGHVFQSRQSDRENILGKGYKAQFAVLAGAAEGDYFWDPMTGSNPFVWITADNTLVPLDAPQMVALKDAGETFKAALTFYARALKDAVNAAADHDALEAIDITSGWPS